MAMEAAAPVYLKDRVSRGKPLPALELVVQQQQRQKRGLMPREDARFVWVEYVVRCLPEDLFMELMDGLRVR